MHIIKFLRTLPAPKLHVYIDLGFFSVNTQTMGRDYMRASFVYQRIDIKFLKWGFHVDLYDNTFHQHKYRCEEFLYRIQQMRLAMDRASVTTNVPEFGRELQLVRSLLENAEKDFAS